MCPNMTHPNMTQKPPVSQMTPEASVNRRIFRAAAVVTLSGVLVKLVATGKEFVLAGTFGRSDSMDAFLIAYLIPGLLVNLFSDAGPSSRIRRTGARAGLAL